MSFSFGAAVVIVVKRVFEMFQAAYLAGPAQGEDLH
jgi:hypothetical protein